MVKRYDQKTKEKAIKLIGEGKTFRDVGTTLGINPATIKRWFEPQKVKPKTGLKQLKNELEYWKKEYQKSMRKRNEEKELHENELAKKDEVLNHYKKQYKNVRSVETPYREKYERSVEKIDRQKRNIELMEKAVESLEKDSILFKEITYNLTKVLSREEK